MSKKTKRKQPHHPGEYPQRNSKRLRTESIATGPTPSTMHDFTDLKAWVAYQEQYQATTSQPAPLTDAQLNAMAQLKLPSSADQFDDTDWVSIVHRYINTRQQLSIAVTFTTYPDLDESLKWVSTCEFRQESSVLQFPSEDFGYMPLGAEQIPRPPAFSRKKDAKQYAAKCCIQWLVSEGRMPAEGLTVAFTKQLRGAPLPRSIEIQRKAIGEAQSESSSSAGVPLQLARPNNQESHLSLSLAQKAASVPKKGVDTSTGPPDVHDDRIPATQRVLEMCRRLKLHHPKYELVADREGGNVWSGYPDFGQETDIPSQIGVIERIYSKKSAREKIAEEVLKYLIELEATRKRKLEALSQMSFAATA